MKSPAQGPLWQEGFRGKPLSEFTKTELKQTLDNEFAKAGFGIVETERSLAALGAYGLDVSLPPRPYKNRGSEPTVRVVDADTTRRLVVNLPHVLEVVTDGVEQGAELDAKTWDSLAKAAQGLISLRPEADTTQAE